MSRNITFDYSKGQVNRAGSHLASENASDQDLRIIENWRAAHNYVLNTFQANLRRKAKLRGVRSPVQRIKRLDTIRGKLNRFPRMQLSRMHDIVGCRVIFDDIDTLYSFRQDFNKSRFEHKRRTKTDASGAKTDAYNYIENPKESGYRGVHDVFEYKAKQGGSDRTSGGHRWNGLLIEIQYRTRVQHAWATAVEICDLYTENHGKFDQAPADYLMYFQLASEMLARTKENMTSCLSDLSNQQLVENFESLEEQHGMLRTLRGIQPAEAYFEYERHTLLVFDDEKEQTEVKTFSNFHEAVAEYFRLERESDYDVVLVAADDAESVRFGFRNYFSDAREFVDMLDTGIEQLKT